ncbi:hypothetical protein AAZV13_10G073900 [Glycine max]
MTMISYLHSSPGLHFYIVFLVEEHTKAGIFISKLCECRGGERTLKLRFLFQKASIFISNRFVFCIFLRFFTSKAVIFYTKTVIFISNSMTTIAYLRSSPGLHFYIVFLVEEHTKAVIFISKL